MEMPPLLEAWFPPEDGPEAVALVADGNPPGRLRGNRTGGLAADFLRAKGAETGSESSDL